MLAFQSRSLIVKVESEELDGNVWMLDGVTECDRQTDHSRVIYVAIAVVACCVMW